ncbi:MAG: cupin domain-containing protein [Bdellovibrionota bacterium]
MLDKIIAGLEEHKEEFFRYFELQDHYDISINFIEAGANVAAHTHDKEVFNYVLEGEVEFTVEENLKTYKKGEWINIASGVPHAVKTNQKATLLELWKK